MVWAALTGLTHVYADRRRIDYFGLLETQQQRVSSVVLAKERSSSDLDEAPSLR